MRWLPLMLGILLILGGFTQKQKAEEVVNTFMLTDDAALQYQGQGSYEQLPPNLKREREETRLLEMENLSDPAPLNDFRAALTRRYRGRIVLWAGFSITLVSLLYILGTRPHHHEDHEHFA